jgi:hypothetical protein
MLPNLQISNKRKRVQHEGHEEKTRKEPEGIR